MLNSHNSLSFWRHIDVEDEATVSIKDAKLKDKARLLLWNGESINGEPFAVTYLVREGCADSCLPNSTTVCSVQSGALETGPQELKLKVACGW